MTGYFLLRTEAADPSGIRHAADFQHVDRERHVGSAIEVDLQHLVEIVLVPEQVVPLIRSSARLPSAM